MSRIKTKSFDLAVYAKGDINSKKLALVLPGRLDTKDYPHMQSHVDHLASKGFYALSFDPVGTWESGGDIKEYTTTNYVKQVNEIIECFSDKDILLVGHSRGGSIAMFVGVENPQVKWFVSIMSSYTFNPKIIGGYPDEEWKKNGYLTSTRDIPNSNKTVEFKLSYAFLEDQIKYDALEGLKKTEKPKMFLYGTKDEAVEEELVRTAYNESSNPKEIFELNSDHDYRKNPEIIEAVNKYLSYFVDKYWQL